MAKGCSAMPAVVAALGTRCPSGPQKESRLTTPSPAPELVFSGSGVDERVVRSGACLTECGV